jgi:hypothetical protein
VLGAVDLGAPSAGAVFRDGAACIRSRIQAGKVGPILRARFS